MPSTTPSVLPATDPGELFRWRDSLYAADLLITALGHLDLFNRLAEQPATQAELCTDLELAARPAGVMLTLFVAMGLLRREGQEERYRLTELAQEHLTRHSSWDLGPYFASLKERPICRDILGVLRSGQPFGWGNNRAEEDWARAMEREDFAATLTAAMDSRGAYLAPVMARALDCSSAHRLLDIAGASGIYAGAVVAAFPHMSAAVLEKPPVDQVARLALARRNLTGRIEVIPGDMFRDPLPTGFDLHLYSHVLHDWDETSVQALLRKSFQALPPGGQIAIHDAHLWADKTGPLAVAEYSVLLMLSTPGKCYSIGELQQMLTIAGFSAIEERPTAANRSLVLARKI